jgi:hypothetical protein
MAKPPKKPTLEERIAKLHEEIDAIVAKHVDAIAAVSPGVPRGWCEHIAIGRAGGCKCDAFKIVNNGKN